MKRRLLMFFAALFLFAAPAFATTASLLVNPQFQFWTSNGPLANGQVYTYVNLTTTPLATYTDATAQTQNPNPVILNSNGGANIYGSGTYTFAIYDSSGNLVSTINNISAQYSVQAATNNSYDASAAGASDAFVQNVVWLRGATVPLAITGGTYSFGGKGTGITLTFTTGSGAITSIVGWQTVGSGYVVGDIITPTGGNYDAYIRVASINGSGQPISGTILYGGTGYSDTTASATMNSVSRAHTYVLTGVLTSAATFIMTNGTYLAGSEQWIVANNTTGSYTTTFFISNGSDATTGTGVVIPQGTAHSADVLVETDGVTDIWNAVAGNVPTNATNATNLLIGTIYQIPYQSGTGTTTFMTAGANGVLVTNGSNVPSISSTLPSGITLVAPVLGTPASGTMTNVSGTAANLTAGQATAALGLKTATTTVSISGSTAPSANQILTAQSSTTASWQNPGSLTSVFTTTVSSSQGADLVLTNASATAQEVTMTSAGWSVTLPDATTMLTGLQYLIVNAGSYSFAVRDYNHKLLAVLQPSSGLNATTRQQAMVTLENNGTQSGVWRVSNSSEFSPLQPYYTGQATAGNSAAATTPVVVKLDSTHFISIYGSASLLKAIVGTASGNTLTYGSETTIGAANNPASGSISATLLQTNSVLVTYTVSNALYSVLLNISGTTITPNTGTGNNTSLYSGGSNFTGVTTMSASLGAVIYDTVTNNYPIVNTLTIGGSGSTQTITLGTATAAIYSVATTVGLALAPISGNSVLAVTHDGTNYGEAMVISSLTSSGGTVNGKTSLSGGIFSAPFGLAALSSTAFLTYTTTGSGNTSGAVDLLTVSGTTVTMATQLSPTYVGSVQTALITQATSITALSATKAVVFFYNSASTYMPTGLYGAIIDTNGTNTLTAEYYPNGLTATLGAGTFIQNYSSSLPISGNYTPARQAIAALGPNQAVAVFPGASSYLNAVTVETVLP